MTNASMVVQSIPGVANFIRPMIDLLICKCCRNRPKKKKINIVNICYINMRVTIIVFIGPVRFIDFYERDKCRE